MTDIEPTVADTIWSQISLDTKMACGARRRFADGNSLTFQVGSGRSSWITVTLDPDDTYTVKRTKLKKYTYTAIETASDVYCDQLSEVIYGMVNK